MRPVLVLTLLVCPFVLGAADLKDGLLLPNAVAMPIIETAALKPEPVKLEKLKSPLDADRKLWRWSAVALVASSGFDSASSFGKREGNTFLQSNDGTFGSRGVMMKSAIVMGTLAAEELLRRKYGHSKFFAIANFVQAGVTSSVAAHNLSVAPPH